MARDERLDRDVAVKVLARELVVDGRFEREARAAARLSHPGIVTLYEAAVDDEGAYLVSELVLGRTLDALLAEGELSDRDIVEIGIALCDALGHAHEQGVVHRDVKPSNVLVPETRKRSSSVAKLTDFGVARVIDSDSLTQTGDVIGTLAYMAPEQAAGLEAGEPADLYALALVLYEALSGVNPLRGTSASVRSRRVAVTVPPLRRQRRDLPPRLAQAIDTALRPRIHERGTIAQLHAGLAGALHTVGDEAGIVAGALHRTRDDDGDPDGLDANTRRLWWPREVPDPAGRGAEPLPEADPSRLIWQGRALGAVGAAAATAWLSHRLIGTGTALAAPLPLTALVAAGVTLLLPRLGWLALVAYLCVGAALGHEPGAALALATAAAVPIVLLPASPTLWPVAAAAPALGAGRPRRRLAGDRRVGAQPVAAGDARRHGLAVDRSHRGAHRPHPVPAAAGLGRPPAATWVGSLTRRRRSTGSSRWGAAGCWLRLRSGRLAAMLVPYLTGSRSLVFDALRVIVWAAALTRGHGARDPGSLGAGNPASGSLTAPDRGGRVDRGRAAGACPGRGP